MIANHHEIFIPGSGCFWASKLRRTAANTLSACLLVLLCTLTVALYAFVPALPE